MKKRILLPILAIASVLILAACGSSGPEKTVDNFMKSYKDLNFEQIEKSVATELEEEYKGSVEETADEFGIEDLARAEGFQEFKDSFLKLTKQMKYKVTDTKVDGDNAEIKVDFTYADASEPIMTSVSELFGQIMGLAFSGKEMTDEEAEEKMTAILFNTVTRNLKDFKAETKNSSGVIKLAKEENEWVITEFDDSALNALGFGVMDGMEEFNPFGGMTDDSEIEYGESTFEGIEGGDDSWYEINPDEESDEVISEE